ncbi:MAG: sialidase family protein, partial [Myxococcota bacterium]
MAHHHRLAPSVAAVLALAACGDDGGSPAEPALVSDQRIIYTDGLHNENTEMLALGDRILLVFRGGETGQVGSAAAHLNVYASDDGGKTFEKQAEVDAGNLPDGRDIRDPKLVSWGGKVYLYAISRLPGGHYRDLFGKAETVRSESSDGGRTWTPPVNTLPENQFWGFWRITERSWDDGGTARHTLYATAYNDGDTQVGLFASDDGISWTQRATIYDSYDDVPSETELHFFGADQATAVAIVRLDNQEILQDGQSAICTAAAPFDSWECGRRIEQRIDGPTWLLHDVGQRGVARSFVFARKHLPCTRKRTAMYELRGDLSDPSAPIEVCELFDFESSGDTAYTAVAPLGGDRFLVSWYSSTTERDVPWLEGQFTPSDIWLADVDLAAVPETCVHPAPKAACPVPALPAGATVDAIAGHYLLALGPVIWPEQAMLFDADVTRAGDGFEVALQPLDAETHAPVDGPWHPSVAMGADGSFTLTFDRDQAVPAEVFPLLEDPFLTVHDLVLRGKTTSLDGFCGVVTGYAQILGDNPADRIGLAGSTFGATRIP